MYWRSESQGASRENIASCEQIGLSLDEFLTLGLDAMRQLAFPSGEALGFLSVQVELGVLLVLCFLFLLGARWLLNYIEKLAIREGRLTESRR